MANDRKAGSRLLEFLLMDPVGEEVLEGTIGGLMAGATQLGSDQPLGQTALETAAAIAGGIGVGAIGRRLGARLGKRIHKDELKNQSGILATIGRLTGSETTVQGVKDQGRQFRSVIEQGLMNNSSEQMMREVMTDPAAFKAKYNIEPKEFESMLSSVLAGRAASGAVKTYAEMSPEQRASLLKQLEPMLNRYGSVERAVGQNAAQNLDDGIDRLADLLKKTSTEGDMEPDVSRAMDGLSGFVRGMNAPASAITGEHVGRAAGRFIGDEVGILGGMAMGSLLAQQLGIDSPKDQKIRELEKQLAARG